MLERIGKLETVRSTKWTIEVYHILVGNGSIILFLFQSIVRKSNRRCERNHHILCKYKNIKIATRVVCVNHVHLTMVIPPKFSISNFMGF